MNKGRRAYTPLRITVALSMLAAVSIVCGKYLALNVGEFMRFSFESLPILLAGAAFGPLAGLLVGVVADLVGCILVGYTINPIITLGAGCVGLIFGLIYRMPMGWLSSHRLVRVAFATLLAHLIGSVLIKGLGLWIFYGTPLEVILPWRALNYLIVGLVEGAILYFLLGNRTLLMAIDSLRRRDKEENDK